jgi:hypothetical protein
VLCGVHVVFAWCSRGVRVVFAWCSRGVRVVFAWYSRARVVLAWCSCGVRVIALAAIRATYIFFGHKRKRRQTEHVPNLRVWYWLTEFAVWWSAWCASIAFCFVR